MALNEITFTDKVDAQISALPAVNKSRAEDWNEVKEKHNLNDAILETTQAKANQNEVGITPGTSNGTEIDLTNRAGVMHTNAGAAMSDLAFTIAASPIEWGCAIILSNAASAPSITGATAHSEYATDYQAGSDNLILVSRLNGVTRYQVFFT